MHALNHPGTIHLCESVHDVDPSTAVGRPVDLLWASPDCTHFSRAKGGKPKKKEIRGLAWVVVRWAKAVRPKVICLENVAEFQGWGPLGDDNRPIKARKGETFREWVGALEALGYVLEWRVLAACDYGAPTTRQRLFVVARCDGKPIVWPEPTHGPGREHPWRPASECIDWSIPSLSIFATREEAKAWARSHGMRGVPRRPLADKTMARIAAGLKRYVLEAADPYIVRIGHTSDDSGKVHPVTRPLTTVTSKNEHLLITPTLIQSGYGERKGQAPRTLDIQKPLGTVVAGGSKHALVTAWLAKHYSGVVGQDMGRPLGTVTAVDHHSLRTAHLTKFYGTSTGASLEDPAPTVTGSGGRGGGHMGLVAAFLTKFYSQGSTAQGLGGPLHTIVSKARFGLVTVQIEGEPYVVTDIAMRMLTPRELATAQGFGPDYRLTGTKAEQIARIGNSVSPPVAEALVRAQFGGGEGARLPQEQAAR